MSDLVPPSVHRICSAAGSDRTKHVDVQCAPSPTSDKSLQKDVRLGERIKGTIRLKARSFHLRCCSIYPARGPAVYPWNDVNVRLRDSQTQSIVSRLHHPLKTFFFSEIDNYNMV